MVFSPEFSLSSGECFLLCSRLNATSDCKKFFKVEGPTSRDRCLALQKRVRAKEFSRQRDHISWTPSPAELPDLNFLRARRLDEGYSRQSIRTDVELDAEGVDPSIMPPESWEVYDSLVHQVPEVGRGGRGRGSARGGGRRGSGRAASRGRGRGAKRLAEAESEPPREEAAASSSSSCDSSSSEGSSTDSSSSS